MSNDIKIKELGNIDFIPEDGHLCCKCILFNDCPFNYVCESLKRLEKYEEEQGEEL